MQIETFVINPSSDYTDFVTSYLFNANKPLIQKQDYVRLTDGVHTATVLASSALKTDSSATTQPISASSLPLPSGASTSALQGTVNTSVVQVDTDLLSFKTANHTDLTTINTSIGVSNTHLANVDAHIDVNSSTLATKVQQYQRPSQMNGRTYKTAQISGVSAQTTIYTVTASKVFYLTSIAMSIIPGGPAVVNISDNASILLPFSAGPKDNSCFMSVTFPEPLHFSTNVILKIASGTLTSGSVNIVGYEE